MTHMNVALVAERVDAWRGGAETSTMQFVRQLLELGIEVDLVTRSDPPAGDGLRVHRISTAGLSRGYRTLRFIRQADELLRRLRPEIVHAITPCMSADVYQPRGGTIPETIARNLAMRKTSAARAVNRLASIFKVKQRILGKVELELMRRTPPPTVIALSDYVVEQLRRHYSLSPGLIRKVFNGVDIPDANAEEIARRRREIRSLYGVRDEEILALFVAHNFKLKGLPQWLKALQTIRQRRSMKVKSLIVGKGDSARYRRACERLSLTSIVSFVGPTRRVQAFFHAADVFVHPTYYDPCSRVVLEAMLNGVPCVTTKYNGAAEVIEDGVTGRVIASPDNIEALARAVEQVSAESFKHALREGHDELAVRLSMKRHAAEVVELYQSLRQPAAVT